LPAGDVEGFVQLNLDAVAFAGAAAACVVDQDAAHLRGRDGEEVHAIVHLERLAAEEAEIGLVDQRRGLQNVAGAFAAQVAGGQPVQVGVDDADEPVGGFFVAFARVLQQLRNLRRIHGGVSPRSYGLGSSFQSI
jgi:hypothetical protein